MNRIDDALRFFRSDEASEERICRSIEKNRKGDFTVSLLNSDRSGSSVNPDGSIGFGNFMDSRVKVSYRLKNHAFRFGANLFMLGEWQNDAENALYCERFQRLFNLATLPFYWKDQEPTQGRTRYAADSPHISRRPPTDFCLDFCEKSRIEPKAHCLNYDFFRPDWVRGMSVSQHKYYLEKRFAELAERYADKIPSWEVVNEINNDPYDIYSLFYQEPDFLSWSFECAEKYFPHNRLIINDHVSLGCMLLPHGDIVPCRSAYYMQVRELLRENRRVDSVGFQYHSFFKRQEESAVAAYRYNPSNLFRIFDSYAALGRKMQITEMTIPAYSTDSADEICQAELIRATYRLFFSLPSMEAVIYWNLPNGGACGGENNLYGGLTHADLSPKPAYDVLDDLIHHEWHSEGIVPVQDGKAVFRGFYGEYELTVSDGTHSKTVTVNLTENTRHIEISLSKLV